MPSWSSGWSLIDSSRVSRDSLAAGVSASLTACRCKWLIYVFRASQVLFPILIWRFCVPYDAELPLNTFHSRLFWISWSVFLLLQQVCSTTSLLLSFPAWWETLQQPQGCPAGHSRDKWSQSILTRFSKLPKESLHMDPKRQCSWEYNYSISFMLSIISTCVDVCVSIFTPVFFVMVTKAGKCTVELFLS